MLTVRDGRIHRAWLEEWVQAGGQATLDGHYYVSGPPEFMRMVQFTLRTLGVPGERIRPLFELCGTVRGRPRQDDD